MKQFVVWKFLYEVPKFKKNFIICSIPEKRDPGPYDNPGP